MRCVLNILFGSERRIQVTLIVFLSLLIVHLLNPGAIRSALAGLWCELEPFISAMLVYGFIALGLGIMVRAAWRRGGK
jgi:hypothetical protein